MKTIWVTRDYYLLKVLGISLFSLAISFLCAGFQYETTELVIDDVWGEIPQNSLENFKIFPKTSIDPEFFSYVAALWVGLLLTIREIKMSFNYGVTIREAFGKHFAWRKKIVSAGRGDLAWDSVDDDEVVIGDFVGRRFDWKAMTIVDDKQIFRDVMKDIDVKHVENLERPSPDQLTEIKNQKSIKEGKIVYLTSQRLRKNSLPAYVLVLKKFPKEGNAIPLNKWEIEHVFFHTEKPEVEDIRKEAREGKVNQNLIPELRGIDGERNFRILDSFRIVMYGNELRLAFEPSRFEEEEVLERGPKQALEMAKELAENDDIESADSVLKIIHERAMQDDRGEFFEEDGTVQDSTVSEEENLMDKLVDRYEVTEMGVVAHLSSGNRFRMAIYISYIILGILGILAMTKKLDYKVVQAVTTGIVSLYLILGIVLCDFLGAEFSSRSLLTGRLVLKRGNEPQCAIKTAITKFADKVDKNYARYAKDVDGNLVLPPAETDTVLSQGWIFKWSEKDKKILAKRREGDSYYEVDKVSSKKHPLPEWRGVRLWEIESQDPVSVNSPDSLKTLPVKRDLYFL